MTNMFNRLLLQFESVDNQIRNKWIDLSEEYFEKLIETHELLCQFKDKITIVMHGSTAANIEDDFSDLDYWLILDRNDHERYQESTSESFIPVKIKNKEGHINPLSVEQIERSFGGNIDINLINEISNSAIVTDKKGIFQNYISKANEPLTDTVRHALFFHNYVEMRSYHRSCDNPMERHDEVAVLFNLMNAIKHGLQCGFVLDRNTFPYEKWIYLFARSSVTARSLLGNIDNIVTELKTEQKALLGPENENKISGELRTMRKKLVEKATSVGIQGPWIEKWWRHIDSARSVVRSIKWDQ